MVVVVAQEGEYVGVRGKGRMAQKMSVLVNEADSKRSNLYVR